MSRLASTTGRARSATLPGSVSAPEIVQREVGKARSRAGSNVALGGPVRCPKWAGPNSEIDGYFSAVEEDIGKKCCDCSIDDGMCDAHAQLEIVRSAIFYVFEEAQTASQTQLNRNHLWQAQKLQILVHEGSQKRPTPDQIREFITYLGSEGKLTKAQAKLALGDFSTSARGGGGTLSYDDKSNTFGSRPAFLSDIVKGLKVVSGQHRRHIIPWHHIRAFVNACLKHGVGESQLVKTLKAVAASSRMQEASTRMAQLPESACHWGSALVLMNSCKANLWVGSGKQNISINSNFFAISKAISSWNDNHAKMVKDLTEWSNDSTLKDVRSIILQYARNCYSRLAPRPALGSAENRIKVPNWLEALAVKSNSKQAVDSALLESLRAETSEHAHNWALTCLSYDVSPNGAPMYLLDAVSAIHRVAQLGKAPTEDDAEIVFSALLR